MRKLFVLDSRRGQKGELPDADGERAGSAGGGLGARAALRRKLVAATGLALVLAAGAAWRLWFAAPDAAPSAPTAPVPDHQRSGQLANPWGNAAPVTSTPADDAAAAARAAAAASASAARAVDPSASDPSRPFAPPSREAVLQALARLRGGNGEGLVAGRDAAAFVRASLQGGDPAALVATWMIERQCRALMQWRRMDEWRQRANPQRPPPGPGRGAALVPLCESMPDAPQVDAALAAAGFPLTPDGGQGPELSRRPIDLSQAIAVGDPMLLAEVLEATDPEVARQLLRAYGADARDIESPDVLRSALWLASCTPLDAAGRPSNTAVLKPACADHPALAQACLHHGLCEARDLRDLLLKSMSSTELGVVDRLGRWVAARMGKG